MHIGKGRRNPLHVDYIFLGACMAYIQDSLFEAILSHPRLDLGRKIALVKALGKVIWIQNDLFARWHSLDGLEYRNDSDDDDEVEMANEAEGFLHGKRVLGNNSSSGSSAEDDSSILTTSTASSGKTSLGRPIEEASHLNNGGVPGNGGGGARCPFSGMSIGGDRDEQRATATRSPKLDHGPDVKLQQFHKPGTPRVRLVDGKTVLKENLDAKPFDK